MYNLYAPMWRTTDTLKKLLKEVLGYTDNEIKILESEHYDRNIVANISIDKAKEISEIFLNNDFQIYLKDEYDETLYWKPLGISLKKEPPKDHYCDQPLVSREHLANLDIPKQVDPPMQGFIFDNKSTPTVTCPYCQSTDTKKITNTSKAVHTALFGIFSMGRNAKEWHCNNCNSDF